MPEPRIGELFASDVSRRIEEVIKVDQTDEQVVRDELDEYVVTASIRDHLTTVLDRYLETRNKPHEGVGLWVSGFFGSGKSSFAKYLGLALGNRTLLGVGTAELLGARAGDNVVKVLLANISERIPTDAVIFDVSTDRGIRSGSQSIIEIMYRQLLRGLGYAGDLDLSELEITLEGQGTLDAFKARYAEDFGADWDADKGLLAIAVQRASRVMHELDPVTYPSADSWTQAALRRADVSAGRLAERCVELLDRRRPGRNLIFVVDEVGQFVARDVQRMLDLQGIVQSLGRVGRGRLWLLVTSQERLNELVGGLDDKRVELARLMDRFTLQVHLEPSDITEVTSRRVLAKNAHGQKVLRQLYDEHRGRLADNTRLTADIRLMELTADTFMELYPLLPAHIDLIIQIVSGLRTQGGLSKHVGGANRTIIKLAQQVLIHPDVNLAAQPVGALVRIDQIYDLVSGNVSSELRGKISAIPAQTRHPLAQAVAKAVCLLQYVRSVHRTRENIAALLHPAVDADSRLSEVASALQELCESGLVLHGDDGYRIPTPAEDEWQKQRGGLGAKPGDIKRIEAEALQAMWQPQPQHKLMNVRPFRAGLSIHGAVLTQGDVMFDVVLASAGSEFTARSADSRTLSQQKPMGLFWVGAADEALEREAEELYRSREMIARKERGAQTKDEAALVAEERVRMRRHQDEVRRLIRQALLAGCIYFRGNERGPGEAAKDVSQAATRALAEALPDVYHRYREAAVRVSAQDIDALLKNESLLGLTPLFAQLGLVHDQDGKPVINADSGPLAEVLGHIAHRSSMYEVPNGRYLAEFFGHEPFGWDLDTVRLLNLTLLRAGRVEVTSQGQVIESALTVEAANVFGNNTLFRQASFRPRTTDCEFKDLLEAGEAYRSVFGIEVPEIEEGVIAREIRERMERSEDDVRRAQQLLAERSLPGADVLASAVNLIVSLRRQRDCQTIKAFTAGHKELKDARLRAVEVTEALTPTRILDIDRARRVLAEQWPDLAAEEDLPALVAQRGAELADLLQQETFFRHLPTLEQAATVMEEEYRRRHEGALAARVAAYGAALERLRATPGWDDLGEVEQELVAEGLAARASTAHAEAATLPLLREQTTACPVALARAVEALLRLSGDRQVVQVSAAPYFAGGIETDEQLEEALRGLGEACREHIALGKKVLVQ